jgi:predicted lipoprotein
MQFMTTLLKYKSARWGVVISALLISFYFVPLFHIKPLQDVREENQQAIFDAKAYVQNFWVKELIPQIESATDADQLWFDFIADANKASETHGKRLGLSSNVFFFIKGEGEIASNTDSEIHITPEGGEHPGYIIEIGPVFSNALRDGTGLLDIASFSNTQEFNSVSSELNLQVETHVFPNLGSETLPEGTKVRFAGGVEIFASGSTPESLYLIPVLVEAQ